MKRHNLLKVLCVGIVTVALILNTGLVFASQGKGQDNGKGKDKTEDSPGNNGQNNGNQGQGRNNAERGQANPHSDPEKRRRNIENDRSQVDIRANRPEWKSDREIRGKIIDTDRVREAKDKKVNLLETLQKARWSYNPYDERGQGNMGKPLMRDPYGFDKDSGREKGERGRPSRGNIEEPTSTDIMGIQFNIGDSYLQLLLDTLTAWQIAYRENPQDTFYADAIKYLEEEINYYTSISGGSIALMNPDSIDYTLTLSSLQELSGKTLLVTTTLTSIDAYEYDLVDYDPLTDTFTSTLIQYDSGQVISEQTQEVVVEEDNSLSFSYDPSGYLAGDDGLYANVTVTVTEPESGVSYTFSYDQSIYLYLPRCPYGRVYNVKTGKAIVGAKVTVHNEDGSIVALDKAANPTVSNPQTTDATGRFGFKLKTNGKYYITATCPSYEDYKSPIFTEKWHVLREDVALTPIK